jgi:hypothetical protein
MPINPVIPFYSSLDFLLQVEVEACLYLVAGGWDVENIMTAKKIVVWSYLLVFLYPCVELSRAPE